MSAVATVHRHSSPCGDWELALGTPSPALRPFVQGMYTGSEERLTGTIRRLELPHPGIVCIFDFGDGYRVSPPRTTSPDGTSTLGSFVAGLHDAWVHVDAAGTSRCVQVNLTPLGALRLLGLPMRELVNRSTPMDALPVAHELQLSEQLHEATGWEARFAMIERALLRRLARARAVPSLVEAAWHRMWDAGGVIDVAQLSRSLGCGRRHLGAMVQEHAGLPPKRLSRLIRFDAAVARLSRLAPRPAPVRLSALAHTSGYYDHAHMDRDFREFAGMSPTEYLAIRHPMFGALVHAD